MSFVRSVTMDKWKESELAKMKISGNRKARLFLEAQDDWNDSLPISQKYQSKAAALLKDKVMVESQVCELYILHVTIEFTRMNPNLCIVLQ